MKKNILTKIVALGLAVATALTPVSASAAEKKVVTREEYDQAMMDISAEYDEIINYEESDEAYVAWHESELEYVKSLDGCYQENGYKIYALVNAKKKTFKKTGKYSIVFGGRSSKEDWGYVNFKAPKSGRYKFVFSAETNVVADPMIIDFGGAGENYKCPVTYQERDRSTLKVIKTYKDNCGRIMLTPDPENSYACGYTTGSLGDSSLRFDSSDMTKATATVELKKGQTVKLRMRSSHAALTEEQWGAYNFCGVDLKISKIK